MKKIKRRAFFVLLLVALLIVGTGVHVVRQAIHGGEWVSFKFGGNKGAYSGNVLRIGTVLDRNGMVLSGATEEKGRFFADSESVRRATLHAVGDLQGNIATGALSAFSEELIGYNFLTGTYSLDGTGNKLYLSIDAGLNVAAHNALNGRKGTVAVMNYKTGEVLCMVSNPSYDPQNVPNIKDGDSKYEGVYLNRFLSSTFVPGSIYKIVTMAAAVEQIPDLYSRTFTCSGKWVVDGATITCPSTHGTMGIEGAFASSCNVTFAKLSLELGAENLAKYAQNLGLTASLSVSGIDAAAGSYEKAGAGSSGLAWSGIGQHKDLVNPAAMLNLMSAIANGGKPATPRLISKMTTNGGLPAAVISKKTGGQLLSTATAAELTRMMRYNVTEKYGNSNFPGLTVCAKSGTAEVESGSPHAWFIGFLQDAEYPLAFVVLVENGGSGSGVAGGVANTVLQAAVKTLSS